MSDAVGIRVPFEDEHSLAVRIATMYQEFYDASSEQRYEWDEIERYVHATDARQTENIANEHDNSTVVPKLAQIADNLEANYLPSLFPNDEWLRYEGYDQDALSKDVRRLMEAYAKQKLRIGGFYEEVRKLLRDWIYTGNAVVYLEYMRETAIDPEHGEPEEVFAGPKAIRIDPRDIVFDPTASSFEMSPKIIRRVLNLGELHRMREHAADRELYEQVLNKVEGARYWAATADDKELAKYNNLHFEGLGNAITYLRSNSVEILHFYGDLYDEVNQEFFKNYHIVVVDRTWVLDMSPTPTWSGRPMIYHVPWRVRPRNLWGQSPLANLVGMQYRINHMENAKADSWDEFLDPDKMISGNVEIKKDGAATIYLNPDGTGRVDYIRPDTTVLQADTQINEYERRMEEYVGAPRDAMGVRTPGEKTMHEVQRLHESAGRVFQAKAELFQRHLLEPMVNGMVELATRYLQGEDSVPIWDDEHGVVMFQSITKKDLKSNGRYIPQGARHFGRRSQIVQNIGVLRDYIMADPAIAQHLPAAKLAEVLADDLLDLGGRDLHDPFGRIFEQAEAERVAAAAQQHVMQEQQAAEGMSPEQIDEPAEHPQELPPEEAQGAAGQAARGDF